MPEQSSDDLIWLTDPDCKVRLVNNARARRFVLRLASDGDGAILTLPTGVPRREAESFLDRHRGWLDKALSKAPAKTAVGPGTLLPVDGIPRRVEHEPGRRRAPTLGADAITVYGHGATGPKLLSWLKARARDNLAPASHAYAAQLGRQVNKISLRDTRSRWGSCATGGVLSFSWRLAMAPREVQDYVAAHEAAHLVEMNHAPEFWAVVDSLMPGWEAHRGWLRREGRALHAFDFKATSAEQ